MGFYGAFLQTGDHGSHSLFSEFFAGVFGDAWEFVDSVIFHSLLDTLKLVAFLFLTYLLMEFLEHKANDKIRGAMLRTGKSIRGKAILDLGFTSKKDWSAQRGMKQRVGCRIGIVY